MRYRALRLVVGSNISVRVANRSFQIQHNSLSEYRSATSFLKFEPEFLSCFIRAAAQSQVVYDVGGYLGLYSLTAACCNTEAKIFVFEPDASNCQAIERNVLLNELDTVRVLPLAVGDKDGILNIVSRDQGNSCCTNFIDNKPGTEAISVRSTTLDAQVATNQIPPPNLVKIDVEGYEAHVLRGMKTILEDHRPVVLLEVHRQFLERYGESATAIDQFMLKRGYRGTTLRGLEAGKRSSNTQSHVAYFPVGQKAA